MSINYPSVIYKHNTGFFIDFKTILGIKDKDLDLTIFCYNPLVKKTYRNRLDEFLTQFHQLFESLDLQQDFWEEYFALIISMRVSDSKITDYRKILDTLLDILREPVNKFVNEVISSDAYQSPKTLEQMDTVAKQELYFSNDHLKRLIKISILSKLIFIHFETLDSKRKKIAIDKIWNYNFVESDKTLNVKNKVQKLCYSRVLSMIYSDKRFWNLSKLHNIQPLSYSNTLYLKILSNVISFINWEVNPIPFIDVYINNNLNWLKQKKFSHSYTVVNTESQESSYNSLTENYKYDFKYENQSTNFVINESVISFLENNLSKYLSQKYYRDLVISIDENLKRNVTFNYVLFPFISKKLKISTERLLLIDKKILSMLVLYTVIELEKNNFILLSQMLVSNITSDRLEIDKKKAESYKAISSVLTDERYIRLMSTKFEKFSDLVDEEKYFLRIIATLFYNKFTTFKGKELKYSSNDIIDELLRFYEVML